MSKNAHTDAEDILSELESQSEEKSTTEPQVIEEPKAEIIEEKSTTEPQVIEEPKAEIIEEKSTTEPQVIEEPKAEIIEEKKQDPVPAHETRNTIPIGKKPIMTYVNSTLTQLSSLSVVTIRARGKSITTAVNVSQFILKRMNSVGYKISDIRISSDLLESNDGKKRNVSSIEIDIMRV